MSVIPKKDLEEVIEDLRDPDNEAVAVVIVNSKKPEKAMSTTVSGDAKMVLIGISDMLIRLAVKTEIVSDGAMTAEDVFKEFSNLTWGIYQKNKKKDN